VCWFFEKSQWLLFNHKRSKSSSYSIYQLISFQRKYKTDLPKGLTQRLYIKSLTNGRNSNRISELMLPICLWLSHLRGSTSTAQQPWINNHGTLHTNTSTWKNRIRQYQPEHPLADTIHFTPVTTTQKTKIPSPFYYTARALPFISVALHLMLFGNVLDVNEISPIIADTLYIVWLALKKEEYNLKMASIEAETCCWQLCKPPVANISCVWLYFRLIVMTWEK